MREARPRSSPARRGPARLPSRTGLALSRCALVFGCVLVWGAALASAAPDIDDPAARVRTTRLDNGLTVLTLEDRTTPVVSLQLWVRVGSRDETRYTGLAHLFEHLMFKGSKRIGPEQHARLIQA